MKFVLIGCGRIAALHVKGYEGHPGAELYGVYDKNAAAAKKFADRYHIPKVYDGYEEVLADPAVTAVELLVPHRLHCPLTVQACAAGKHVSVQKPMAMNLKECDTMIEAARKHGVQLRVYENFVFYPPYQLAKKLLDGGEIGEPQAIRYKMTNGGLYSLNAPGSKARARAAGIDVDGLGLEPTGWKIDPLTWAWRFNESLSGGGPVVFDDGYHKFSLFMHLLGEVEKVCAWIDYTPVLPGIYQDSPATIMWKHKGGKVYGVFDISYARDLYVQSKYYTCDERMEITGSRGVLWVTRCTASMLPGVAPVIMYRDGKITEYRDLPVDWADSFKSCTRDFIDALKDDREPVLSGEKGREVLKFALAALDSAEKKREIYLDEYEDRAPIKKRGFLGIFNKKKI